MDKLEAILGKAIYDGIRSKCRGYIVVKIQNDECVITIKYDELTYTETFWNLSGAILNGIFTSDKVVNAFVSRWRSYAIRELNKKMFYKERP